MEYTITETDIDPDVLLRALSAQHRGSSVLLLSRDRTTLNSLREEVEELYSNPEPEDRAGVVAIPPDLFVYGLPRSLVVLRLSNHRIPRLPEEFGTLVPNLEELMMTKCQLEELPESIGLLTGLQDLIVRANRLTGVPASIRDLTQLGTLAIDENRGLQVIPSSIGSLPSLISLIASHCSIRYLPRNMDQMSRSIRMLLIDANDLRGDNVPWKALSRAPNLTLLQIDDNPLATIGPFDGTFPSLTQLELRNTRLVEFPESVLQITTLRTLILAGNQFSNIPPSIDNLQSLKKLDLTDCTALRTLPIELLNIRTLRTLIADMPRQSPDDDDDDGNPRMHPLHESVNYQIIQQELEFRLEEDRT
jgi:Leucine-rich repeat (LRR) protein